MEGMGYTFCKASQFDEAKAAVPLVLEDMAEGGSRPPAAKAKVIDTGHVLATCGPIKRHCA